LKALVTIAEKTQQRAADIAEIAQNYDNGSGRLNAGYDRAVTEYDKTHPFLTPEEISNYKKIADANAAPAAHRNRKPPTPMRRKCAAGAAQMSGLADLSDAELMQRYQLSIGSVPPPAPTPAGLYWNAHHGRWSLIPPKCRMLI
jgi:hypothetical protein